MFWWMIPAVLALAGPDSLAGWRSDLLALKGELERTHPRFHACGLPPELAREVADIDRSLASRTDAGRVVAFQRLLASVGDGHTQVWPFGMTRGAFHRVPLGVWEFADGVFVVSATRPEWIGRRVVAVDGRPVAEALRLVAPLVAHDNAQQLRWAAPFYLTCIEDLDEIGIGRRRGRSTWTFAGGDSAVLEGEAIDPERLDPTLPPPAGVTPPLFLARRDPWFATRLPDGTRYVQVNAMRKGLAGFAAGLRDSLAGASRLVLDLRRNTGGEASEADELLRTLIAFDVRGGKTAVLIGRMTFSAAGTFAARIDQWTAAIFVGEPTGARPNHFGNERPFHLPYSGVSGTIASGLNQPVTARDDREAIVPDVPVELASADYFAGRDPVLDAARSALRSP